MYTCMYIFGSRFNVVSCMDSDTQKYVDQRKIGEK